MGNFHSILKSLRTAKGITQEELSKLLKISRSTIGMYENGSWEPDYETLESIADFFHVDIDYLLGRTTKTTKILNPTTIATHFDGDEYTEEELDKIKEFAAFVKNAEKIITTEILYWKFNTQSRQLNF